MLPHEPSNHTEKWLAIEEIATIEVTSEDPDFPIESVFNLSDGRGWRAKEKGEQHIRIIFDQPTAIRRLHLRFVEPNLERTQEFTIRYSAAQGRSPAEIVRQQWNFSPAGSTSEIEDYQISLDAVSVLELTIKPDLERRDAEATLAEWRVA